MHFWDGVIFMFAMSFVAVQTVFPVLITELGGTAVAVGLIPVLWNLGLNLPQILLIRRREEHTNIKPVFLRYALYHRILFLVMGLFLLFVVEHLPREVKIGSVLFVILLMALSGAFAVPNWYQLLSKTTPVTLRGRLLALRQLFGALLGVGGGSAVTFVLASVAFPYDFSILFLTAFFFMIVSFGYIKSIVEVSQESGSAHEEEHRHAGSRDYMRKLLKKNKNFRWYLVADFMMLASASAASFYSVYGLQKFSLQSSYTGIYTIVLMASMSAGNVLFGLLADRKGHLVNLRLLNVAYAAASLMAVAAFSPELYGVVFFFMGIALTIHGISRLSIVAEMTTERERRDYLVLLNSMTAPAFLTGLAAGYIVESAGYPFYFTISAMLAVGSFLVLSFKVKDPRESL
ncbi:MAG: hypothetical protein FMNOHCHN_01679 [Ignavibacteriaceae bacterium]|nr:hypothetical protein [Ignavibacteriaceae bacterium]